ncbi:hypothetical protein CUJ83_04510 [Methanocella sp. CWC-04]|uniref:Uncharacterized protein n=1 Tax=Methanooceanicella nereidis TaxID=2052831 RepID=A0AAP2RBB0_9EURY|nr:hypothetical protein [Methanocella sp. CWC-04]MCD1294258.1 hypothetical protein [Methanocella sp. CWC-04]
MWDSSRPERVDGGIYLDHESMDAICESVAGSLGFKIEHNINLGVGRIDQVWSRQEHPNLPEMKFAVQILNESGDIDPDIITTNAMRSLWSDCDHLIFVVPDSGTQKSIQGKIRSFDSIGGFLQLHKYITTVTLAELTKGTKHAATEARA